MIQIDATITPCDGSKQTLMRAQEAFIPLSEAVNVDIMAFLPDSGSHLQPLVLCAKGPSMSRVQRDIFSYVWGTSMSHSFLSLGEMTPNKGAKG